MNLMNLEGKDRGVRNRPLTLADPTVYNAILYYIIGIKGKRLEKIYPLTFSLKRHKRHKVQDSLPELIFES